MNHDSRVTISPDAPTYLIVLDRNLMCLFLSNLTETTFPLLGTYHNISLPVTLSKFSCCHQLPASTLPPLPIRAAHRPSYGHGRALDGD